MELLKSNLGWLRLRLAAFCGISLPGTCLRNYPCQSTKKERGEKFQLLEFPSRLEGRALAFLFHLILFAAPAAASAFMKNS